jgi:hypothetical protein
MMIWLADVILNEEDKRNLKTLADEVPKLRILVEELVETLDILGDENLMKSIKAGEKDIQENRLITFKELLAELKIDEEEI